MVTIATISLIANVLITVLYFREKFESNELRERKKDLEIKIDALTKYYESTININKTKR